MHIPTDNQFHVAKLEDTVIVSRLSPSRLTREEAINLGAWLLHVAQPERSELAMLFVDIELDSPEVHQWTR